MKQRSILLLGVVVLCWAVLTVGFLLIRGRNGPEPAFSPLSTAPAGPARKSSGENRPAGEVPTEAPGEPGPSSLGTIRGRVFVEAPPAPAPGARVAAIPERARSYAMAATAGEDGAYELVGLDPGRYRVLAWSRDWAMEPLDREEELVEVAGGQSTEDVDRTLIPGGAVAGRVLEEGTEEPIPGATVECRMQYAITDQDGSFRIEGVRPGLPWVSASAPGFTSKRTEVEVTAGGRAFVEIELAPGGGIEGVVTNPEGRPAAGAAVWTNLYRAWSRTAADAGGRYALEGVPLGARDITVHAALDGRFETRRSVHGFPEGETLIRLDLQLESGFPFAGRVVDVRRKPIPGAELYIETELKPIATTGADGRFTIDRGSGKMPILTARRAGYSPASQKLEDLKSDEERQDIEIVLEPGHFVEGRVVDAAGSPVHRAWVAIDLVGEEAGPYPSTHTDREGRFRLEDLPAKFGGLAAAKPGYSESRGNQVEADRSDVVLVLVEALIEGIVVERASGEPIPLFKVSFEGGELQARDGRFRISSGIDLKASYRLIVVAEGYSEGVVDGVKAWLAGSRAPLRFELKRGGALHERVVSTATGAPLEGVRVTHVTEHRKSSEHGWFDWLPEQYGMMEFYEFDAGVRSGSERNPSPSVVPRPRPGYDAPVAFIDWKTGRRYEWQLEPITGSHGHPDHVLVLRPSRGGPPRRVERYDRFLGRLLLSEASLDEVACLDRAGLYFERAPMRSKWRLH